MKKYLKSSRLRNKQINKLKEALILRNRGFGDWEEIAKEIGINRETLGFYRKEYGEDLNALEFPFEEPMIPENTKNILVIGDLHEPFCLDGYLEFCKKQYKKYKCNHVIFIGDVIDSHFSSYHEPDPDGMTAGDELVLSIKKLSRWHKAFPNADVVIGNHDRIVQRKAYSSGVSKYWVKEFKDALNVPTWSFKERFVYDDVQYIHGEGGKARQRCRKDLMPTVQGHYHTEAYTEYVVGSRFKVFGSQVGCGIDHESYAMAYARNYPKPAIGCLVVLDNGKQPINIMANLIDGEIIN